MKTARTVQILLLMRCWHDFLAGRTGPCRCAVGGHCLATLIRLFRDHRRRLYNLALIPHPDRAGLGEPGTNLNEEFEHGLLPGLLALGDLLLGRMPGMAAFKDSFAKTEG